MRPSPADSEVRVDGQASVLVRARSSAERRWIEATKRVNWIVSFVVGILAAVLIIAGMFLLLVSQKL